MSGHLTKCFSLFAALLLVTSPAFGKGRHVDLSVFKGNYSGTLSATEDSSTVTGKVTLNLTSAKNGKTARLIYQGSFTDGSKDVPISTSITLHKEGTSSVSSLLLGLGSEALPGTGTAHFNRHTFTFTATAEVSGDTYKLSGKGTVTDSGRKRSLTLKLQLDIPSEAIAFTNTLTAKVPKK